MVPIPDKNRITFPLGRQFNDETEEGSGDDTAVDHTDVTQSRFSKASPNTDTPANSTSTLRVVFTLTAFTLFFLVGVGFYSDWIRNI